MEIAVKHITINNAKPFIKWAGGKGQILELIKQNYPKELFNGKIDTYIEPFVGGGAVLFEILKEFKLKKAIIIDNNKELINTYKCIKLNPEKLLTELSTLSDEFLPLNTDLRKNKYYEIRNNYNTMSFVKYPNYKKAAMFIFLNRTCYNGLYRVNKSGGFNVPIGSYKNPKIFDESNILYASELLEKVDIFHGEYSLCNNYIDKNVFVYFDPPYRPLNSTSNFTSYTGDVFGDAEQIKLAELYKALDKRGAKLMLSNSDPKNIDQEDHFFDNLYSSFNMKRIQAKRMINSKASKRGNISELLITNY